MAMADDRIREKIISEFFLDNCELVWPNSLNYIQGPRSHGVQGVS